MTDKKTRGVESPDRGPLLPNGRRQIYMSADLIRGGGTVRIEKPTPQPEPPTK